MKKLLVYTFMATTFTAVNLAQAKIYDIDTASAHASIQFKIQHLGFSWLYGRFNDFEGTFDINRDNLEQSSIEVTIDTSSVDSNHAERDKHLRSPDFLNISAYPEASFKSTSLKLKNDKSGVMSGNLTLNGVTKSINIVVTLVGEGADPWGGYRVGFDGRTTLLLKDFNINTDLGPSSTQVDMILSLEGIRR